MFLPRVGGIMTVVEGRGWNARFGGLILCVGLGLCRGLTLGLIMPRACKLNCSLWNS